jgi:hypothetical protein
MEVRTPMQRSNYNFLDEADESAVSTSPFTLTKNRHLHRTMIAVGINILAQKIGVNIITFYYNTIFEGNLHYSGILSRIITRYLHIWQFLAAGLAVLLINRIRRRPLFITAATSITIAQTCLARLSSDLSNKSATSVTPVAYLFCSILCPLLFPYY